MTAPDDRFVTPPPALIPVLGGSGRLREDLVTELSHEMEVVVTAPASDATLRLFLGLMAPLADIIEHDDGEAGWQELAVPAVERAMATLSGEDVLRVLEDLGEAPAEDSGYLYRLMVDGVIRAVRRWPISHMTEVARSQARLFDAPADGPRLVVSRGRRRPQGRGGAERRSA